MYQTVALATQCFYYLSDGKHILDAKHGLFDIESSFDRMLWDHSKFPNATPESNYYILPAYTIEEFSR